MALRSHPQTTGTQFVACDDAEKRMKLKYHYMIACDWKAEMNLRTPRLPVRHSVEASRMQSIFGVRRLWACSCDAKRLWSAEIHLRFQVAHYTYMARCVNEDVTGGSQAANSIRGILREQGSTAGTAPLRNSRFHCARGQSG